MKDNWLLRRCKKYFISSDLPPLYTTYICTFSQKWNTTIMYGLYAYIRKRSTCSFAFVLFASLQWVFNGTSSYYRYYNGICSIKITRLIHENNVSYVAHPLVFDLLMNCKFVLFLDYSYVKLPSWSISSSYTMHCMSIGHPLTENGAVI